MCGRLTTSGIGRTHLIETVIRVPTRRDKNNDPKHLVPHTVAQSSTVRLGNHATSTTFTKLALMVDIPPSGIFSTRIICTEKFDTRNIHLSAESRSCALDREYLIVSGIVSFASEISRSPRLAWLHITLKKSTSTRKLCTNESITPKIEVDNNFSL